MREGASVREVVVTVAVQGDARVRVYLATDLHFVLDLQP